MKNLKKFFEFINENNNTNNASGRYITLETTSDGLWLHITPEGKQEMDENFTEDKFWNIFEDIQVNSEWMYHDDIGEAGFGLTSAPGFTDGYFIDDDGNLSDEGHEEDSEVYWFPNYQVESFTETLITEGKVFFDKAEKSE